MIEDICTNIVNDGEFKKEYNILIYNAIAKSLGLKLQSLSEEAVQRLLQAASLLSESKHNANRLISYEVVTNSYDLYGCEYDGIKNILYCILSRLGNFPSVKFFNKNFELPEGLPSRLSFLSLYHQRENTPEDIEEIVFTDYQKCAWELLKTGKSAMMTAPTSAGKSFIAQQYLLSNIKNNKCKNILYMVPTRALINQVQNLFSIQLKEKLDNNQIYISSTPIIPETLSKQQIVFIFTQERLELFLNSNPDMKFDIIIVDEAHLITESSRGVKLESILHRILSINIPQVIFISPEVSNPEKFKEIFDEIDISIIPIPEPTVSQNLILIDVKPTDIQNLHLRFKTESIHGLGTIALEDKLGDEKDFLPYISAKLGYGVPNLIYGTGKANCEKIAALLKQHLPEPSLEKLTKLKELSILVKEHIHPKYILADVLIKGIGFHYGTMPTIVRKSIEKAFEDKIIDYLVCTSTLLHGVNLPAKNLFIMKPTKGRSYKKESRYDIPLSSAEFWNLAGRVGRLGKEFSGNIFLINYDEWDSKPLDKTEVHEVKSAVSKNIEENQKEFLDYLRNENHKHSDDTSLENTFMKLFIDYKNADVKKSLSQINVDDSYKREILSNLEIIENKISLPVSVLRQNSSVSAIKQERLYQYLLKKVKDGNFSNLIPIHPQGEAKKVICSLRDLIRRTMQQIDGYPTTNRSFQYFASLGYNWIIGKPLPQIIEDNYQYITEELKKRTNLATVIRKTLDDIEDKLRFKFVNNTACYISILSYVLKKTNNESMLSSISAIPLYLEVGASSITMINLMNLGFSRLSASKLKNFISKIDMDESSIRSWFKKNDISVLDIPIYVLEEVRELGF